MFDFDLMFLSPVDNGVDLDALEDADHEEHEEEEREVAKPGPSREEVNAWLIANNYTAYDTNDPRLKKLAEDGAAAAKPSADEDEKDKAFLDDLLIKDPHKYAAEISRRTAERTRSEMGEATKLQNQLLRELQKEVPELQQEDFDRISESVTDATLAQLREWKSRGSVITAGKAAAFDRGKKGGEKRSANTNTDRVSGGGGGGDSTVPRGLQPALSKMGDALRANGIDVKDEDIAGSSYMPKRKR